jgi:putative ABC transport system ATP-binding protein
MIYLKNVVAHTLPEGSVSQSPIWGQVLELQESTYYALLAPSGKGKSTFINLIYGLRTDFDGSIYIDNRDTKTFNLIDWTNLRTSYLSIVFQDIRLFSQLSALDNIVLKNKLTNYKTRDEILQMAQALDVADILQQRTATLSFGQRQRVAIIRALCQPFKYLLLDEPFAHLDERNTELAKSLIVHEVAIQGASVILSSLNDTYQLPIQTQLYL